MFRSLRIAAPSSARPTCIVHALEGSSSLLPWQLTKLQRAARQGRRQISIEKLCKDVDLPRQEVLQWLKANPAPERPEPTFEQDEEPTFAAQTSQRTSDSEWQRFESSSSSSKNNPDDEYDARQTEKERARALSRRPSQAGNMNLPPWKRFAKDRRPIGRQAESTLEMIFERTDWPSDDVISSMWDLHRIQKYDVIQWFQNKRREVRSGGRGGRGGGINRNDGRQVSEEEAGADE